MLGSGWKSPRRWQLKNSNLLWEQVLTFKSNPTLRGRKDRPGSLAVGTCEEGWKPLLWQKDLFLAASPPYPPGPQSRGGSRTEHPLSLYIKCQVLFITSLPTRYQCPAYCKGNIPRNGSAFQCYGAAGTILGLWWNYSTFSCFIKCHMLARETLRNRIIPAHGFEFQVDLRQLL